MSIRASATRLVQARDRAGAQCLHTQRDRGRDAFTDRRVLAYPCRCEDATSEPLGRLARVSDKTLTPLGGLREAANFASRSSVHLPGGIAHELPGSPSAYRQRSCVIFRLRWITVADWGARPGTRSLFNYRTRQFVAPAVGAHPELIAAPSYKMSDSLLYVVNYVTNTDQLGDVAIYDAKAKDPKPIAIITDGIDEPTGDCIDAAGTLYVPQNGSIAEYAAGQTKPSQYITQGRGAPAACAIDSKGNLWVAALFDVIEYLKGSNQPHKFIENGVTWANSIAFDHRGNMYVGNLGDPYYKLPYNVQVYAPGRKAPSRTITNRVTWPVEITVDADNTLYVANLLSTTSGTGCGNVEEYRAGHGRPFRTLTDEISGPSGLAFYASGRLYEANGGINQCNSYIDLILEFAHGSKTPSKRTITIFRSPNGVAYYPPQLP